MIELPVTDPCGLCEGMAGREQRWTVIGAGRERGTAHDSSGDAARRERVRATAGRLAEAASLIRSCLPR